MGDSRWGNIFDVFVQDGPLDKLDDYPVLIVLGQVAMDDALRARLHDYAQKGGNLVLAAGVAGPGDASLTGAGIAPELRVGRAWTWAGEPPVAEAFRYVPATLNEGAIALAQTPHGDPLIVRQPMGEGAVYTSLIPWFEGGHQPLSGVALRLLDAVISDVQPVTVEGLPVEWLSTTGAGHRTAVIANHDGHAWEGTVHVKKVDSHLEVCTELRTGETVDFVRENGGATVRLQVPAYEVRILRWTQ
jgi:hypothetical protein